MNKFLMTQSNKSFILICIVLPQVIRILISYLTFGDPIEDRPPIGLIGNLSFVPLIIWSYNFVIYGSKIVGSIYQVNIKRYKQAFIFCVVIFALFPFVMPFIIGDGKDPSIFLYYLPFHLIFMVSGLYVGYKNIKLLAVLKSRKELDFEGVKDTLFSFSVFPFIFKKLHPMIQSEYIKTNS